MMLLHLNLATNARVIFKLCLSLINSPVLSVFFLIKKGKTFFFHFNVFYEHVNIFIVTVYITVLKTLQSFMLKKLLILSLFTSQIFIRKFIRVMELFLRVVWGNLLKQT